MSRLCPVAGVHRPTKVVKKILQQHIHTFRREQEHTMTYLYSRRQAALERHRQQYQPHLQQQQQQQQQPDLSAEAEDEID